MSNEPKAPESNGPQNRRQQQTLEASVGMEPFAIEADHPRNCTLSIKSLVNVKLRSAFVTHRPYTDAKTGKQYVPLSQMKLGLPPTPGMQLAVHPARRAWRVHDPLSDDPGTLEQVVQQARTATDGMFNGDLKPVPTSEGKLGVDEFKSLVREMLDLVESGEARVIHGVAPSREQCDDLPGRYLLNPGIRTRTTQPRYEEDFEGWVSELGRVGG